MISKKTLYHILIASLLTYSQSIHSMLPWLNSGFAACNNNRFIAVTSAGAVLAACCGTYYFANNNRKQNTQRELSEYEQLIERLNTQYQELIKQENVTPEKLQQRFTAHQCTQHSNPSIESYYHKFKKDREQVSHIHDQLRKQIVAWQSDNNYHPLIARAQIVVKKSEQFLQKTEIAATALQEMVPVIDHAVTYYATNFAFSDLINSSQWQLDTRIRTKYRDDNHPYPHIRCVNHITSAQNQLYQKETRIAPTQPLVEPSALLRNSLQTLMSNVVTMNTYQEQQRAKLQHETYVRQTIAKEQLARAEQERARAQEQTLQEIKRKNDLAQQQLEVARNQQLQEIAASIAHRDCKATIQARDNQIRAHEQALQRKQQEIKNYQTQRVQTQAVIAKLHQEVTRPPFNPAAAEESIGAWFEKVKQHVITLAQRQSGQTGGTREEA